MSSPLGGAGPAQAGVEIHVGGRRHAQVVGLCPAGCTQLVLMVHQALVHFPISWRDLRAVYVHILSTCLGQDHIVSEILHLEHAYGELQKHAGMGFKGSFSQVLCAPAGVVQVKVYFLGDH